MSRRGGSILNGAPSLETSNQAQIDDLVQRNRTIEHTNKRLSEQLTREMSRSKEALETMRQEWVDKRQEWHQASTDLLTLCRIDQKRVEVELERERSNALQEMKFTRDEKLLRLQRDFRIKLFQMREEELERKIEEIKAEKQRNKGSSDLIVRKLEAKCADSLIQLKEEKEERAVAERERDEIEVRLSFLYQCI
jgi:DNA replication protein DnaD